MAFTLTKKNAEQVPDSGPPQPGKKAGRRRGGKAQAHSSQATLLTGGLPSVNVVTPTLLQGYQTKTLITRFAVAGVLVVAGIGGVWYLQSTGISAAEEELAAAQSQAASLQADVNRLLPVQALLGEIQTQNTTIETTMAAEVYYSRALTEFAQVVDPIVQMDTLDLSLTAVAAPVPGAATDPAAAPGTGVAASACADDPTPFTAPAEIGCVTFQGTAKSRLDVAKLIDALFKGSKSGLLSSPFVTITTAEGDEVKFSGSVALTPNNYSGRWGTPQTSPAAPTQPQAAPAPAPADPGAPETAADVQAPAS